MPILSSSNPSFLPSPSFLRSGKQNSCFFLLSSRSSPSSSLSAESWTKIGSTQFVKLQARLVVRASVAESQPSKQEGEGKEEGEEELEEYEVELEKPYGLKFVKGRDGGTYIDAIAPGGNADNSGVFAVGDKVIATRSL